MGTSESLPWRLDDDDIDWKKRAIYEKKKNNKNKLYLGMTKNKIFNFDKATSFRNW
jgi:hypothetical protein